MNVAVNGAAVVRPGISASTLDARGVRRVGEAEAFEFRTGEPAADGLFADAKSGGGVAQRATGGGVTERHLGSRQRGERGISVHVVRAGFGAVVCSSTTSLPDRFRADNLLKHDT